MLIEMLIDLELELELDENLSFSTTIKNAQISVINKNPTRAWTLSWSWQIVLSMKVDKLFNFYAQL